jgi:AmpD protein
MGRDIEVDLSSGLFKGAELSPSPNQDDRPDGMAIEVVIIHCISLPPAQYGGTGVAELFSNRLDPNAHPHYHDVAQLKVSAHLFIRRDGELVQFVPLHRRAWHAGESFCEGRARVNDFSIGIELEGAESDTFTDAQYIRLAAVTRELMRCYPALTPRRIYAHSDIAPGRKSDPGAGFDWDRYLDLLA